MLIITAMEIIVTYYVTSHFIDGLATFDCLDDWIIDLYQNYVVPYLGETAKMDFASLYLYDPSVAQATDISSGYFRFVLDPFVESL